MNKIPITLQNDELSDYLISCGLERIHQGKVRDTWKLSHGDLLVVTTDRISIFDFVLNATVPKKGEVLTALTNFWANKLSGVAETHLVTMLDKPFNAAHEEKELFPELPLERCLVVENFQGQLYPFEMIYRHYIGGSVFKKYQETGMAGGHILPKDLPKWSFLNEPIFTPSTKEEIGHDINVDAQYFFNKMEEDDLGADAEMTEELLSEVYSYAYKYAKERGIIILDTKFEVAQGGIIVDEILTPDSSRFTTIEDWEKAMEEGRDPAFYDKQPVRDWGAVEGLNKLKPENPEHVAFVHSIKVPEEVISACTERYLWIFEKLTGYSLKEYQKKYMGI